MWADGPSTAAVAQCRRRIAAHLPARDSARQTQRISLRGEWDAWRVASALVARLGDTWLEDADAGHHLIACSAPILLVASGTGTTLIAADIGPPVELGVDLFGALDALRLEASGQASESRLFGYLGYELGRLLEQLPPPAPRQTTPDAVLGLHDVWLEGHGNRWELVSVGPRYGRIQLQALADRLLGRIRAVDPQPGPLPAIGEIVVRPDDREFEQAVADTVSRIVAGEVFQTNLCRRFSAGLPVGARWPLYQRMRQANPARRGGYVELQQGGVLSMSPESFLSCRDGHVESAPIKGTRARIGNYEADAAAAVELVRSGKDAAELAMIVDLVRNDLGRVCQAGSVRVRQPRGTMWLPTVIHTYARIEGVLRPDSSWVQLLRAAFPPGSITGAPKIQAMAVAQEIERAARGPAMGSLGWIALGGDMELSVAIRTAVVESQEVVYHAGGGIVAESEPALERLETLAKARAFLEAVRG